MGEPQFKSIPVEFSISSTRASIAARGVDIFDFESLSDVRCPWEIEHVLAHPVVYVDTQNKFQREQLERSFSKQVVESRNKDDVY